MLYLTTYAYKRISIGIGIVLASLLLSGCSTRTVTPYLDVGVGYTFNTNARIECPEPYRGEFELGLELPKQWTVGINHRSAISCGSPFNDRPEIGRDEIVVRKRFGGRDD